MGRTASLAEARRAAFATAEYLDSATVVVASCSYLEVELVDGSRVDAKMALALPYRPAVGDELLVIGNARAFWVIGVVSGRGAMDLRVEGDIDIHAVGGKVRLDGDRGVDIGGSHISLRTKDLSVVADKVVEKFTNAVRHVREMWTTRSGERHEIVDGNSMKTAKRVTILAKDTVAVNGRQIHLG
jgi:hypothetical protein